MIEPLPPNSNDANVISKMNELIGAFNERVDQVNAESERLLTRMPPHIQRQFKQVQERNQLEQANQHLKLNT